MRRWLFLGLIFALGPSLASDLPKGDQARLAALARKTIGADFRLAFHLEKNAQICGGEGDAYVADVEMNKPQRFVNAKGEADLKDHWVKVDKSYSIFVRDLIAPNAQLFDNDNCLE